MTLPSSLTKRGPAPDQVAVAAKNRRVGVTHKQRRLRQDRTTRGEKRRRSLSRRAPSRANSVPKVTGRGRRQPSLHPRLSFSTGAALARGPAPPATGPMLSPAQVSAVSREAALRSRGGPFLLTPDHPAPPATPPRTLARVTRTLFPVHSGDGRHPAERHPVTQGSTGRRSTPHTRESTSLVVSSIVVRHAGL